MTPDGIIATFAGQCGQRGFAGDDGPAAAALLDRPSGVEIGPRRRGLHRRHPQPEDPRRLSADRRRDRGQGAPMRNHAEAGKSSFATMALACCAAGSAGVVARRARTATRSACGGLFCNARPPDPFAPLPGRAERRERRLLHHQGSGGRRAHARRAHPDPLHGRRGEVLLGRPRRRGADAVDRDRPAVHVAGERHAADASRPTYQTSGTCIPQPITDRHAAAASARDGGRDGLGRATGAGGARRHGQLPGRGGPLRRGRHQVDDPATLKMWLTDNGYVVSDAAAALIDVYVRENKYFVALKLLNGVGVKSIQPIVLDLPRHRAVRAAAADGHRRQPGHAGARLGAGRQARRAARLLRDQDRRGPHRLVEPADRTTSAPRGWSARPPTRRAATRSSTEYAGTVVDRARVRLRQRPDQPDDAAHAR